MGCGPGIKGCNVHKFTISNDEASLGMDVFPWTHKSPECQSCIKIVESKNIVNMQIKSRK